MSSSFTNIKGMTSCTCRFVNQLGTECIGDQVLHTERVTLLSLELCFVETVSRTEQNALLDLDTFF